MDLPLPHRPFLGQPRHEQPALPAADLDRAEEAGLLHPERPLEEALLLEELLGVGVVAEQRLATLEEHHAFRGRALRAQALRETAAVLRVQAHGDPVGAGAEREVRTLVLHEADYLPGGEAVLRFRGSCASAVWFARRRLEPG